MKTKLFTSIFLSLLVIITYSSCSSDGIDGINNVGGSNNLKSGQIKIKAYPNIDNSIIFYAVANKINIDWGDGSKLDEFTPNGVLGTFSHEYMNQNYQTITITTESMTEFDRAAGYLPNGTGKIYELIFNKCPDLKKIYCARGELTVLNVEGCTSLTRLYCEGNKLSASALNSLFNSLPIVTDGYISIKGNPGYESCDISIAQRKGWIES